MVKIYRFTASWCQPCKQLAKVLEAESIDIPVYDIETNKELVEKYKIKSVPTIVIDHGDGIIENIVGSNLTPYNKENLRELLANSREDKN